jgi:excisionase family DNA binding protein
MQDREVEQLLTTEDVAQECQVPAETVRYWRHAGTGPVAIRVGRYVRYRRADVAAWVAARPAASR